MCVAESKPADDSPVRKGLSPEIVSGISACGGWVTLCQSENPTGDRIIFMRAYKSFVERQSVSRHLSGGLLKNYGQRLALSERVSHESNNG